MARWHGAGNPAVLGESNRLVVVHVHHGLDRYFNKWAHPPGRVVRMAWDGVGSAVTHDGLSRPTGRIRSCRSTRRSATSLPPRPHSVWRWPTTPARPVGRGTGACRSVERLGSVAARR